MDPRAPLQVLGEGRSGVPQYRQPHVYLAESFVALTKLGVDMHSALLCAGGIQINSLVDNFSVHPAAQPIPLAACTAGRSHELTRPLQWCLHARS